MQMIKHKVYGIGEVVSKEPKGNSTRVTVRFSDGQERIAYIPESFETDVWEAQGSLKDEIDAVYAARHARVQKLVENISAASESAKTAKGSAGGRRKTPCGVTVKGSLERGFEEYLIRAGYKEETDTGNPSTVSSYCHAVDKVAQEEGMSWDTLKDHIAAIVPVYDVGGRKELIGAKSNSTVINALKRFLEFVDEL